ncbi:hypothetical protein IRP63_14770 (plasmid) [Clostridium botulinum]|uniref:Phage protein n=1 Tax=Clostridium botulinum C/D str. DC5 TaxID=1443128 RepID=A0A0A0HZ52_CLOBO|nr:hypothetical protein [Clostridium botulinum]KEH99849.1 hypothetical protein Z952_p0180 [Clostridium botulinum C/D str. BKT75002]KEI05327.1 hypothetical protein Z954_0181 [Clostridium botulinum C/D str. BKT2873]KGM93361.1 hypothetical protein Z955_15425 [Clostridium botulinum C/D str. DC5]KOC56956.1 hypothetical protein ADU89_01845 [Clostridium botulinum]KOC57431.1 hypothetical protein ADU90_06385 [Clostridium botulinum]
MSTPFSKIYDKFLSQIEDGDIANLSEGDLKAILFSYMDTSISLEFKQCKKDLLNHVDMDKEEFTVDITSEEINIIALGMVVAYLQPKIRHEQLLIQQIGDRDYKTFSGANLLKELMELEQLTKRRLREYVNSYTYNKILQGD